MSMHLSVYVGPYFIAPKDFKWHEWESVVCDGRVKAGIDGAETILIPNQALEGVDREMRIDRYGDFPVVQINPATIVRETAAFSRLASEFIKYCDDNDVEIHEAWGVVPCWS